jgi:N-carbamoyl-L-amino-acid hydrolase
VPEIRKKRGEAPEAEIDLPRLKSLVDGVNRFGRDPRTGGFDRPGYSDADMAARRWFADQMRADGLAVTMDGVANVFGRYGPDEGPSVMAGSHLDTVPQGGAFDGVLGVCVALECVRAMRDARIEPPMAVEVVATAEEEGRFGGMLGSQSLSGQVSSAWLEHGTDADGVKLADAMAAQGLDAMDALRAARQPGSVLAFLELHIEQGPILETRAIPVGIVDAISGVSNLAVTLKGKANHSGTTPMDMRADAFVGLSQFAIRIPSLIADHGTQQTRITIGKVDLQPNFPHTIPGIAEFSVITRDTDESVMRNLVGVLKQELHAVAGKHDLSYSVSEKSWLPPASLDDALVSALCQEAENLGLAHIVMPSGAGHDAQTMQAFCPSGLIFVPSRAGISHAPEEWTDWEDIQDGAQLMLNMLIRLCRDGGSAIGAGRTAS